MSAAPTPPGDGATADRPARVALVTGAARGIGAATVRALAGDGWQVIAFDRCADDPDLDYPLGTAAQLSALAGPRVLTVTGDVRCDDDLAGAVRLASDRFGGLDAAVAAAGVIAGGRPHWELDPRATATVLEVNLGGVLGLARHAVPALLDRPGPRSGRFVAVASAGASRGLPMLAAYCGAKAGVTGFVRALAAELRGTGVTANCVSPGSTDTPILAESARLYGLDSVAQFAHQQAVERLLRPEEVASLIGYLLGPSGGAITGADLAVDGGMTI